MTKKSCVVIVGLLAALALAVGCDDDNPTAPDNVVVIYQNTNYQGDDQPLLGNQPDLDDLPGCGGSGADWNDCISSIRIPSGWQVTVFEEDDYSGASATFTTDIPDLERQQGPCGNDWDDCISSIRLQQR